MPEPTTPTTPPAGDAGNEPQPQAGTPPPPQAGSGKTPEDYERMLADLRKENAGHRTKLKKFEEDEAARTSAQMTEQERLQHERDELQAANEDLAAAVIEQQVNQEIRGLASKFNFIDALVNNPDLIARMLDWNTFEWDEETGRATNIEKVLAELAKTDGLTKPAQQQQPGQRGAPQVPAMNPGRSSITQPGQATPGRIPSWDEIYKRP